MVDAIDSKSIGGNLVRVQVSPAAQNKDPFYGDFYFVPGASQLLGLRERLEGRSHVASRQASQGRKILCNKIFVTKSLKFY